MSKLENATWSALPASNQKTIHAPLQAAGPITVEIGPVRLLSIGEVLVWGKLQSVTLAAHVLEKLYPVGCVAYGEAFDRRVNYIQTEAKKVNSSFRRFVTKSLGASM